MLQEVRQMRISDLGGRALTYFIATAMLAGCAGVSPLQQRFAGSNSAAQLRAHGIIGLSPELLRFAHSERRHSWMAPDAKKTPSLLYVADEDSNDVYVYSYPAGKLKGMLTGFNTPAGMCSNKAGDVFILNGGGTTVEVYAHGGSAPLRTLDLPGYPELNCTVDPTTGNLALGTLGGSCGDCIAVFADAQGIATTYEPSGQDGIPGCGYDNSGNLFCDAYGVEDSATFELFELPEGSYNLTKIAVNYSGLKSGPVQWDGKYLAIGSGATGTIYQLQLSGSTGSVEGSTSLSGTGWVWQFWIAKTQGGKRVPQGTRIIAPTYAGSDGAEVAYWSYPAGGDPTKTITNEYFSQPDGATLSTIKKKS
jgi:hypothetical protein